MKYAHSNALYMLTQLKFNMKHNIIHKYNQKHRNYDAKDGKIITDLNRKQFIKI